MTPTHRQPWAGILAWGAAGTAVALSLAALGLEGSSPSVKQVVLPTLLGVPGALIAAARPRIAIGWLLLGVSLLFAAAGAGDRWVRHADTVGNGTGVAWAIWITDRASALLAVLTWLVLVLLPDGRLPSRHWRPVVVTVVLAQCAVLAAFVFARGPATIPDSDLPDHLAQVPNPVGVLPSSFGTAVEGLDVVVLQVPLLLAVVAVAMRLRRASTDERARVVGVLLSVVCLVLLVVLGHALWPAAADLLDVAGGALFAVTLTAAVLRRRLQDVEVAVRPAVVYTVLTALIAGVYVLATGAVAQAGHELPPFGAGVVAAAVALAMLPLRSRLQGLVDRLLHGDVRDPYRALERLADHTHDAPTVDAVLTELAAAIAASLRVPWVEVAVADRVVSWGERAPGSVAATAEVVSGGTAIGTVTAAPQPGRQLRAGEARLLAALGRHGGLAVTAALLAEAVWESRQRLVTTREDERQRLRRDLHDGLGPTLAGLTMQLAVVQRLVRSDPAVAQERLARLQDFSREALESVRRLARELRPPALDELGLVEAVCRVAEDLDLRVTCDAAALPPLSAAVEVAAYRIAAEALSNVARHARTDTVAVSFTAEPTGLVVSVVDRGVGIADAAPGVGLLAMRERAEELGGSFVISSQPGAGTRVTASLPLQPAPAMVTT